LLKYYIYVGKDTKKSEKEEIKREKIKGKEEK